MLCYHTETEYKLYAADGVPMAQMRLSYPVYEGEGSEKQNAAEEKFCAGVRALTERFSARAEEEYQANADPRKRFRFRPYVVTLSLSPGFADEGLLSLGRLLTVTRRAKCLCRLFMGDTFLRKNGIRLPLSFFTDGKTRRSLGAKKADEYYLTETGDVCLRP